MGFPASNALTAAAGTPPARRLQAGFLCPQHGICPGARAVRADGMHVVYRWRKHSASRQAPHNDSSRAALFAPHKVGATPIPHSVEPAAGAAAAGVVGAAAAAAAAVVVAAAVYAAAHSDVHDVARVGEHATIRAAAAGTVVHAPTHIAAFASIHPISLNVLSASAAATVQNVSLPPAAPLLLDARAAFAALLPIAAAFPIRPADPCNQRHW
mmetsp:Transcript_48296/g.103111  ORF Transcript_48296/g.103111 Transcript_48296/m.103111 type:complete len:212 (-) Transcript_48296:187-822(-)